MIVQKFLHSVSLTTLWNVQTLLAIIAKYDFQLNMSFVVSRIVEVSMIKKHYEQCPCR